MSRRIAQSHHGSSRWEVLFDTVLFDEVISFVIPPSAFLAKAWYPPLSACGNSCETERGLGSRSASVEVFFSFTLQILMKFRSRSSLCKHIHTPHYSFESCFSLRKAFVCAMRAIYHCLLQVTNSPLSPHLSIIARYTRRRFRSRRQVTHGKCACARSCFLFAKGSNGSARALSLTFWKI